MQIGRAGGLTFPTMLGATLRSASAVIGTTRTWGTGCSGCAPGVFGAGLARDARVATDPPHWPCSIAWASVQPRKVLAIEFFAECLWPAAASPTCARTRSG